MAKTRGLTVVVVRKLPLLAADPAPQLLLRELGEVTET